MYPRTQVLEIGMQELLPQMVKLEPDCIIHISFHLFPFHACFILILLNVNYISSMSFTLVNPRKLAYFYMLDKNQDCF